MSEIGYIYNYGKLNITSNTTVSETIKCVFLTFKILHIFLSKKKKNTTYKQIVSDRAICKGIPHVT